MPLAMPKPTDKGLISMAVGDCAEAIRCGLLGVKEAF